MKTHPQHRELSISIAVVSAFFFNEMKAAEVFPIATTGAIEFGFPVAFDGNNYLVGIQGDAIAQDSVTAQLVSQSGTLVGSRISTGEFGGVPFLSFDGTNHFMVWDGAGSNPGFHGQFISKSGMLVGSVLTISPATTSDFSLAYGGRKYLFCWSDGSTVSGQMVTSAGALFGTSFAISGTIQRARENAVAFDGTNFFVVFNGGGDHRSNIYGQFVSPAGGLIGGAVLIDNSADPSDNPLSETFDGTNLLITFNDEIDGPGTDEWAIFGRLVDTSGTVLANRLTIANNPGRQLFPFSVFDGSSYLVAWNDGIGTSNSNLVMRFFDLSGQPLGLEFSPFTAQGTDQPIIGVPLFDGAKFLVVGSLGRFTEDFETASGNVYGTFIPKSSTAEAENGVIFDTTVVIGESATSFGGQRVLAQKFRYHAASARISSISVQLTRTGQAGEPKVEVWTDRDGRPSSMIGSLTTVENVQQTGVYSFLPDTDIALSAETDYWVVVRGSLDSGLGEQFRWWYLSENATGTGDGFLRQNTISNDSGNTWREPFNGWPNMMKVEVKQSQQFRVAAEVDSGLIILSWDTSKGSHYRVQTSTELISWINLGDIITGDGSKVSWRPPLLNPSGSFYRILREEE